MEFSSVLKTHTVVVVVVVSLRSSCYISSIITGEIFISFLLDAASQHLKPNALCDDDADDSCLFSEGFASWDSCTANFSRLQFSWKAPHQELKT
jgi:hypothetical protein